MIYAVIMAGGVESRFWPKSRVSRPKQFLNLHGEQSLLQQTISRIEPLVPAERVLIVTNESYRGLVAEQVPAVPDENIIGEPVARNTAPCIAMAAAWIHKKDPQGTMIVLPSDHVITQPEKFLDVLRSAAETAQEGNNLVTIGIRPHRPETGYGYIQIDENSASPRAGLDVFQVKTFAEKPDLETAIRFVDSGDFLWNSGMFIWNVGSIISALEDHLPQIYTQISELDEGLGSDNPVGAINKFYHNCISISIDYGIMEKAETVFVVPGDFGWNDVGSWMAVYELADKDAYGNVIDAENQITYDSSNCYVSTSSGKMVALVGLQGVAMIETDDAIMIAKLESAQDVKKIVNGLGEADNLKGFK